jgi:hypothetical protein
LNDFSQSSVEVPFINYLQAFGDWTGTRFLNKYAPKPTTVMYLTGESSEFNIENFSGYDIRKFNESHDTTTQIRSYALPEYVYNNYNLFENYIGSMVGGLETSANSIGRKIYERTANFVQNHADIDVCNINPIYSIASQLNVPIDDYNITMPSDIQRLMDLVSIGHKKLWGDRCKCNYNFKTSYSVCENCGHKHSSNRGNSLDTDTYTTTANTPYVVEYKLNRNHYEVLTPLSSNLTLYSASSAFLINDVADYCYYEYIPTFCNVQNEGIINWDDEYTTIDETVSGLFDWYGDNQIVEKMLNYYLHKGLGF